MWPAPTPTIRIHSSGRQDQHAPELTSLSLPSPVSSTSSAYSISPALPMAIPNHRDSVPPPLPPPRHIDELNRGKDPGWQWANGRVGPDPSHESSLRYGLPPGRSETLRSVSDFAHLHTSNISQSLPAHSSTQIPSMDRPESRDSDYSTRPNLARLQSETRLSLRTLHSSAAQFDRQLLSKLGGAASSQSSSYTNLSVSLPSPRQPPPDRRTGSGLQPLHVPDHRNGGPESPVGRWHRSSPSALSSTSASAARSPLIDSHAFNHMSSPRQNRSHYSENAEDSYQAGYGRPAISSDINHHIDPELHTEGHSLRGLNISDKNGPEEHVSGSRKRRAPSPTLDDPRVHRSPGNQNDLYRRRSAQMLNSQLSPPPYSQPPVGSASTVSSSLAQSSGSHWGNSMASSITSYRSEKASPGALSPAVDMDLPRLPRLPEHVDQSQHDKHWRPEVWEAEGQNALLLSTKAAGLYACECCLKKPRRFRTLVELRHHEAEKQYQCQYCPNRFKNKNEAERHQNSLHLRRNSWSCAALNTGRQAFHAHAIRPDALDVCGYCGQEFPNPADWRLRNEHLVNDHKFGECNQQKKFFRADHFRQHLKHSHGAASGKWTAQLENICIKEEIAPQPLRPTMEVGPPRGIAPISSIIHENQPHPTTLPPPFQPPPHYGQHQTDLQSQPLQPQHSQRPSLQ